MEGDFSYLFHALGQLDRLLEAARDRAENAYGEGAAADPYRGFYVSPFDFGRLLGRPAGGPLLWSSKLETSPSGPLQVLQRIFALGSFEVDTLLIALAPEIDLRYQRLYAYLQDDVTRRRPSVDLVLNLLCPTVEAKLAARRYFYPQGKLVESHVLRVGSNDSEATTPLLAREIRVEDSVVSFLLGRAELDQRLNHFCTFQNPDSTNCAAGTLTRAAIQLAERAVASDKPARFYFQGPRGSGRKEAAATLAAALDLGLLRADLRTAGTRADPPFAADLLQRDTRLLDALLYVDNADTLLTSQETSALDVLITKALKTPGVAVIAGEAPWASLQQRLGAFGSHVVTVRFRLPDFTQRAECWKESLESSGLAADPVVVESLASRFQLTESQIQAAAASAEGQARLRAVAEDGSAVPLGRDLFAAARAQSAHNLGSLARKITPRYQWKDLVLPEDPLAQLAELCNQARHRQLVYGNWGFDRKLSLGKGLSVLFSGPPGAGKTMAAEVMAAELELDLFKIDLSQIVSKYIGETEKNLNRVFEEARASNAILFFDEADALFGKRSEVRDSHDRYANIEIAYLLQKMEEYQGISCLATNLKKHLDEAFTRRLSFIIDFPFPDEESRLRIWRSIWPDDIPLSDDLDLGYVARKFRLSGGSIKNVAVAAAFLAADQGDKIRTEHLVRATQREYQKMGKTLSQVELGSYGRIRSVAAGGSA